MDPAAVPARASSRRRHGGDAGALSRGNLRRPRHRCSGLGEAHGTARHRLRRDRRRNAFRDPAAATPCRDGALRAERPALGDRACALPLRRRARTRPPRGERCPRDAPARGHGHCLVRADPRHARPRGRLAAPARRLAGDLGRARVVSALTRWRDRDEPLGDVAAGAWTGSSQARSVRRDAEAVPGDRGRRAPAPLPASAGEVPLRPRRREGRLRALRAGAMGCSRVCTRRHRPSRGHARRDRRGRGRRRERQTPRTTVRPRLPSRASSTRRGPRTASTRSGRTRTSRTDRC